MTPEYVATSRDGSADRTLEFGAGRFIFHEGDLGTEMYIVHEGRVEIVQEDPIGESKLAVLERGDFFGEMSVLEDLPRTASARALTDVKLIMIDGATFDSMLRANPEIAVRIMRKLSRRLRRADELARRAVKGEPLTQQESESKIVGAVDRSTAARLSHAESGVVLGVKEEGSVTIGRRDPVTGIRPDVDLTDVDPERSSSRRHAKIFRDGSQYFLVEDIGATNGTFLNDSRIRTGVPVKLAVGDTVRFGLVELVFLVD